MIDQAAAAADILLVDDRSENLLALEGILEPLGQTLVRAMSGDEALKKLLARDFAVILLDVQMPGLNGFDTARLIKSRERSRHIPIIFLTALSTEEAYVDLGYSVGAVDYISKPFRPAVLRSKVAVFVDLYAKGRQLERQARMLRESERRELELRHAARLRESEAKVAGIVDSAMDAIIAFDSDQRITLFNAAAERMFACVSAQMIGKPIGDCFPPAFRDEYLHVICGADASPSSGVTAMTGQRYGGEQFPIEATVSCMQTAGTKVYTVIARDVTERRRAEEALRQQTTSLAEASEELRQVNEQLTQRSEELERAMSARSRFYASMSHELRTPINAILGYLRLLLDNIYGPLNDRQAHSLDRTQKAAMHLLELVNDALDLSKIEAGKIELSLQPVGFPSLIEDLFVTVRPMAQEHGCTLTLERQGDATTVYTDPRRVRQILLNLLSNAVKFGRGCPVQVVSRTRDDGGVEVEVTDFGDGIPQAELSRIFDEFVQVGKPREREGTGLGLPISRRLAALLDGSIDVTSRVGEGSTFRLVLPPFVTGEPATHHTAELDVTERLEPLGSRADGFGNAPSRRDEQLTPEPVPNVSDQ